MGLKRIKQGLPRFMCLGSRKGGADGTDRMERGETLLGTSFNSALRLGLLLQKTIFSNSLPTISKVGCIKMAYLHLKFAAAVSYRGASFLYSQKSLL
jgi:hypothetical protein